ncbi:hypothetical protein vseg_015832 [Gypsophila vaccaria]
MNFLSMPFSTRLQCHDPTLESATLIPRSVVTTTNVNVYASQIDMRMMDSRNTHQSRVFYHEDDIASIRKVHSYNNTTTDNLHSAAYNGDLARVQEMVHAKGGLLWSKNSQGSLPLHVAVEKGHVEVALYLIRAFPKGSYALNHNNESPIYLAVVKGYKNLVENMLNLLGGDSKARESLTKDKSLFAAITSQSLDMVQTLLKYQPKLIKSIDDQGWTPLSHAAYTGVVDIVDFILEKFPESVLKDSSYPIHKACLGGHVDVLKTFERHCAVKILTKSDRNGLNILHHAARAPQDGLKHVVAYLLSSRFGRNLVKMKDETNRTPFELARYCHNGEVELLFYQYRSNI